MRIIAYTFCCLCLLFSISLPAQSIKKLAYTRISCDEFGLIDICGHPDLGCSYLLFSTPFEGLMFETPITIHKIDSIRIKGYILCFENISCNSNLGIRILHNEYQTLSLTALDLCECYEIKRKRTLIHDWKKDLKFIVGFSNGIVAGEIIGIYVELKFGEKTGFALEGGYGIGIGKYDSERWAVGVKGYYHYWFLSAYFGATMNAMNKNTSFTMNDNGTFILDGSRTIGRKGISLLGGYDKTFGWLHLTVGIGTTLTRTTKLKLLPAWNLGIGLSITDLILKINK
ncbi:MAG: hypothetical protein LBQ22_10425 [Bacteroidales bacterium]|jgi:hypothetical protein|nr:hypothetical protein [Bacteroidales bacterium]